MIQYFDGQKTRFLLRYVFYLQSPLLANSLSCCGTASPGFDLSPWRGSGFWFLFDADPDPTFFIWCGSGSTTLIRDSCVGESTFFHTCNSIFWRQSRAREWYSILLARYNGSCSGMCSICRAHFGKFLCTTPIWSCMWRDIYIYNPEILSENIYPIYSKCKKLSNVQYLRHRRKMPAWTQNIRKNIRNISAVASIDTSPLPAYTVRPTRSCSSVPKLETGTPKLLARHRKSKNYSRVEFITRPTECPTQPRRMIDASRVYTFI